MTQSNHEPTPEPAQPAPPIDIDGAPPPALESGPELVARPTDGVWQPPETFDAFEWEDADLAKMTAAIANQPFKVKLQRIIPGQKQGKSLTGYWHLDQVTQELIVSNYGGGGFDVRICDRRHKYVMQRRVTYPGAPILTPPELEEARLSPNPFAAHQGNAMLPPLLQNPNAQLGAWSPYQQQPQQPADRLSRVEDLVVKLTELVTSGKPQQQQDPQMGLLTTMLLKMMDTQQQSAAADRVAALEASRRLSNPATVANTAPADGGIAQLKSMAEIAKFIIELRESGSSKDKTGEFLNETLPRFMESITPGLIAGTSGLTKDPATKQALINAAESAAKMASDAHEEDEGQTG